MYEYAQAVWFTSGDLVRFELLSTQVSALNEAGDKIWELLRTQMRDGVRGAYEFDDSLLDKLNEMIRPRAVERGELVAKAEACESIFAGLMYA